MCWAHTYCMSETTLSCELLVHGSIKGLRNWGKQTKKRCERVQLSVLSQEPGMERTGREAGQARWPGRGNTALWTCRVGSLSPWLGHCPVTVVPEESLRGQATGGSEKCLWKMFSDIQMVGTALYTFRAFHTSRWLEVANLSLQSHQRPNCILSTPALCTLEISLSPELAGVQQLLIDTMFLCGTSQNDNTETTSGLSTV